MSVLVAMNGKVPAEQAAQYLGCSYSHLVNLIKKKKIKAQKNGRLWMVEQKDLEHARSTSLVKGRGPNVRTISKAGAPSAGGITLSPGSNPGTAQIQIEYPKEKLDLIKMAFHGKERTLREALVARLDALYNQIQEKMKDIEL